MCDTKMKLRAKSRRHSSFCLYSTYNLLGLNRKFHKVCSPNRASQVTAMPKILLVSFGSLKPANDRFSVPLPLSETQTLA